MATPLLLIIFLSTEEFDRLVDGIGPISAPARREMKTELALCICAFS